MSDISERYSKVAADFTRRVDVVPADAWGNASPCEGWDARDVVRHLVEWMPAFLLGNWDVAVPPIPSVDDDPVGAWAALRDALRAALDDPAIAATERDTPMGRVTFEQAFAMAGTTDNLVHTWDLARAAGLDDKLDPDEVHRLVEAIGQFDDTRMRTSGHYGPRIEVADDADEQTQPLGFMGRHP